MMGTRLTAGPQMTEGYPICALNGKFSVSLKLLQKLKN